MKQSRRASQQQQAPGPGAKLGDATPKRINVANQAVADELVARTQVLFIQQEENYKQRDHVSLLGGELDALKKVVEGKQVVINRGLKAIADRDDTIAELRKTVHELTIERSAFKVMEDQNASLLRSFQRDAARIDAQEKELQALKAAQGDIRGFSDAKLQQAVQVEVLLNASIADLTVRLGQADVDRSRAVAELAVVQNQCADLKRSLTMVNDLRVEQAQRSRQTEYKTLRRIDEMSSKYQHERDEKDKMRETVQLAQLRGDVLEERLSNALESKNEEQMMVETIVSQVEFANDAMRTREQMLERDNAAVHARLKLSQKAVSELVRRYRKLEGLYGEAKEEAFQATLYAKTHHLDRRAYALTHGSAALTAGPEASVALAPGPTHAQAASVRRPHPGAPAARAKTPKPPVPDSLAATRDFIAALGSLVELGGGSVGDSRTGGEGEGEGEDEGEGVCVEEDEEEGAGYDESRYPLDAYEGEDGEDGANNFHDTHTHTRTTTVGTNSYSGALPPRSRALPQLVTTDGLQHDGKRALLLAHLNLLLNMQTRHAGSVEIVSLPQCALTDDDFKLVVQYLRLVSLHRVRRIDLSGNLLTAKSVDALAAWVVAIPAPDLVGRSVFLDIDVRGNHLSLRSLDTLGQKIKATPRAEVPLVAFERGARVVALYASHTPVLKIDGRGNGPKPGAPTIRQFVKMPPSITDSLPVRFPGEPGDESFVYPRDGIMKGKTK